MRLAQEQSYFYFADQAGDGAADGNEQLCVPTTSLRAMEPKDGGAALLLYFQSAKLHAGSTTTATTKVELTVGTLKHKDVMEAIISAINKPTNDTGFIVVADDENSVFLTSDITAGTTIVTV